MSNMKNGFCTLNRWLGRKKKERTTPNGKLSHSTANLNHSLTGTSINETSHLEYNRITPLPVVTSNAPFEQTFRITVLLPKDQLYVARLGARVPLSKLLELVCDHKQLDAPKYEFRNPVDPSQTYSCDLTIGAVGLSEIRLCHKSETYDTFNADEVIKLHRTSVMRDSLSSSEFSSHNSKHTTKTASPYSSSNSLNSMDSAGMSYSRSPVGQPPAMIAPTMPKVMAPPRKKRAAPRPPSQAALHERSTLIITNSNTAQKPEATVKAIAPANGSVSSGTGPVRRDFYDSVPNLALSSRMSNSRLSVDCNGNSTNEIQNSILTPAESPLYNNANVEHKNALNRASDSVQNTQPKTDNSSQNLPEPSPRKRTLPVKKKTAPEPPRGSACFDDNVSITSSTFSTSEEIHKEKNTILEAVKLNSVEASPAATRDTFVASGSEKSSDRLPTPSAENVSEAFPMNTSTTTLNKIATSPAPKPVPRVTTGGVIKAEPDIAASAESVQSNNISKIMLNRTPTPEPRSHSSDDSLNEVNKGVSDVGHTQLLNLTGDKHNTEDDDNCSKQDSGIGEPVPSPLPDSLQSDGSAMDGKLSTFESSSDDDDMVKVYNFKLGKTLVQQVEGEQSSLQNSVIIEPVPSDSTDNVGGKTITDSASVISESASWNFQIPISPPPNFADQKKPAQLQEEMPDTPITPKINERPVLVFDAFAAVGTESENGTDETESANLTLPTKQLVSPLQSPITSAMNDILDELNAILSDQRMESLIKKPEEKPEIESAKPCPLSNFSIASITEQPAKEVEPSLSTSSSQENASEEEKLYRKCSSITSTTNLFKQRRSVTRADSCHATMQQPHAATSASALKGTDPSQQDGLNARCASYLSLTKVDENAHGFHRRRSSSELSIGESPSLQSLEIIKTILSSRKNSLNNHGSDGESKSVDIASESKPKNEPQMIEKQTQKMSDIVEKPLKDVPKIYRYSGPPSINFSTWSERPKVEVAIKNEGDYIFGGRNASNQNTTARSKALEINQVKPTRSFRASTPAEDFREFKFRSTKTSSHSRDSMEAARTPEPLTKKVTATMRMGIPEKTFRSPITVKPIADDESESNVQFRSTFQRTTSPPKSTGFNVFTFSDSGRSSKNPPRPVTMFGSPSTLPRSGFHTRFSTPSSGASLLRSTSITQLEQNKPKSEPKTEMEEKPAAAPFGQNTLRKTGFKEKIVGKDAPEQDVNSNFSARDITNMGPKTTVQNLEQPQNHTQTHTSLTSTSHKSAPKSLQSAKLEMKLQRSTSACMNHKDSPVALTTVNNLKSTPTAYVSPQLASHNLKSVTKRSQTNGVITPMTDTREQLLEAIRNFKREELHRS